jgi:uncharacterized protein (TIGR04141 family)
MNKYNLYRINKEREEELVEKLEAVGLEIISTTKIDDFIFQLFFSKEPDEVDIWWVETYRDFLPNIEPPKNKIYFGTLIISNPEKCYAVSLGKSHFYLRQYCDSDFGLDLAERIIDPDNLKIKNSKFYKSKKSKSIVSYHDGSEIAYDSGESMHYLKGKVLDTTAWGKSASFGSSVQFNLELEPAELVGLITRIEQELTRESNFKLPRVDKVRDENKKNELDQKLVSTILATQDDSDVSIEEFTVSGVNFIFSDADNYSLYIKGFGREKVQIDSLNIESLLDFVRETGVNLRESINEIQVFVHREYGRDFSQPLKFYLDFIDDEDRYCLIDGEWHKFNQSYLDYLKREVDTLEIIYDANFDINDEVDEDDFNTAREENNGYIKYDKVLTSLDNKYRVEKMDLYKDNSLYFVKKGKPQKLSYVIDQAITTVKILQNRASKIEIEEDEVFIENIYLWMIIDRKEKIERLSEINSLILHMKLVDWKKTVIDAGYQPKVMLNYIVSDEQ